MSGTDREQCKPMPEEQPVEGMHIVRVGIARRARPGSGRARAGASGVARPGIARQAMFRSPAVFHATTDALEAIPGGVPLGRIAFPPAARPIR